MARIITPNRLLGVLGILPALSMAVHVHAESEVRLEAVSVTAKGYAADEMETPVAILGMDRDEILVRNANIVAEVLRGQPGLAVASDGAQGQNPVIRGMKKESIVLLMDGMRLNSAQPAGAVASFMSLGLADRVEVVKGPASVLYGTGALGGVINVRLPQARFEAGQQVRLAGRVESGNGGVRGTALLNSSSGDHAMMAGASLARIGDYRSPDGKVERSGYDSDSFIGQYRYRFDPMQQLRVSLQQHTDTDVWYPGSTKPHFHPLIQSTTVHSPKTERRLAELGYERKGSGEQPVNLDIRVYQQEMKRQIFSRSEPQEHNIAETRVTFATDGVDLRADWLAHEQHLLSFGVNAWQMGASPERYLRQPPHNGSFVRNDPFRDARIEALGFYLQDDINLDRLNLLLGLRHDTVKGSAAEVGNPPVTTHLDRSDSAVSGSLGAIYEITPLVRPFVNLARGFRAGEMRERYEASPRGDGYFYLGNPQIKPEIANQMELGMKGASRDLKYTISFYRNRISDYMSGRVTGAVHPSGMPIKATENIGSVTLTGMEAQAKWQIQSDQWLGFGYSRVRGENDDLNEPLFQMPADELSLGWEGRVTPGWMADATLRMVNKQDRVATIFSNGTEQSTPGFATADMGATYRWRQQSLRLAIKNIADRRYHEHLSEGKLTAPGRSLSIAWQGDF